jgi:glutamate N-acetyltransferase/amino-acid N-acetyltransferase
MAKGAGMIRPNMATMLSFIMTDASFSQDALQLALNHAVDISFNRITVDGDTSTNDSCVLLASGESGAPQLSMGTAEFDTFKIELNSLMQELAQAIIRDAEGATKFITLRVSGGDSEDDCLAVAYTVAESPLVKTAFFASDPNWGRILAAVGRAPLSKLDIRRVGISLNDVSIVSRGEPDPDYTEAAGQLAMSADEIIVDIVLGDSDHSATVWTSDLSLDYVRINAEYRS